MRDNICRRFPGNNFTADTGLDTADIETFKKDAISSLAREICQNSIDAKDNDLKGPVRVVFKSFEIEGKAIPGRDALIEQINACIETQIDNQNTKIVQQLNSMLQEIKKDKITCLRISDFNTTGLIGVDGGDNNPRHYLIHGSGLSNKGHTSGGSKGIGKFATFVTSFFNTVFYSTITKNNEIGYEGICKLCSAKIPGTEEKTQGIGYYGSTDRNLPINEFFSIDKDFYRNPNQYGTDIYVMGFKSPTNWENDIIAKILDSFMAAIIYDSLEVEVNDVKITKNNLENIVLSENYLKTRAKKSIICQYKLLTDNSNRFQDIITIENVGSLNFYLLGMKNDEESLATNSCVMIRYPYMKIKEIKNISTVPCCAMCVIEDETLNKIFRDIENPQHTDWEFNRIDDETIKREVTGYYRFIVDEIKNLIIKYLSQSDETSTNLEGAEDFLGYDEIEKGSGEGNGNKIVDKPEIYKKVNSKKLNLDVSVENEFGDGAEFDNGEESNEDNTEIALPDSINYGAFGPVKIGTEIKSGNLEKNNEKLVTKPINLSDIVYRFYCTDKNEGKYNIYFESIYNEEKVGIKLFLIDDYGNKEEVKFLECVKDNKKMPIINENEIILSIKNGEKVLLMIKTNQNNYFSGEVKAYAYR